MSVVRFLFIVTLAALAAACSRDAMLRRFTPADADARARNYLALFVRGRTDSAAARLAPELSGPDVQRELGKVGAVLKDQRVDSAKVIGVQTNTVNGVRRVNLAYELHAATGWILANVATVDSGGTWAVEGVAARPIAHPLEEDVAFSLAGKGPRHYLWLLATVLCAVISLGTAIFLASRRAMPKRWRWVLASLIGVGAFTLNWSTGEVSFQILHVQFFAAGFVTAGPAAPWMISFGIPIGAIAALSRYRRWRSAPAEHTP